MILVTGGTGLVGAHLLYHLSQKNDVILATYRSEKRIEQTEKLFQLFSNNTEFFKKIKWLQADITKTPSLEEVFNKNTISKVYHCAAMISFNPKDFNTIRGVNIEGTANIVNFCIAYKVNKLCHVSSISTLGEPKKDNPINEEDEWNIETPHSDYAITKNGAEMEVWRASQEGLDIIIVNPGIIFGNGFIEGSNSIITQVKKGLKFYTEGVSGFVGVSDVVDIMIRLMESEIKNERFILVAENKSYKEILCLIADNFDIKRPTIKAGKIACAIFWRIEWLRNKLTGKNPLITKETARSSNTKEIYSSRKIEKTLTNFEFDKIEDVLEKICSKY